MAAFSDCRSTMRGSEGEIIDGRYRLVRIGIESVVMEYPDGRGRTTIGQARDRNACHEVRPAVESGAQMECRC